MSYLVPVLGKEVLCGVFISKNFNIGIQFPRKIMKIVVSIQSHRIPQDWGFSEAV
jgi:hypothetical protein